MASAEMPGASIKATTPAPVSKKQNHLVAGRRKLDEYRKKKAGEKKVGDRNNSAEKPIANDGNVEGIFANGSDIGPKTHGNVKETHVVSSSGVNGLGAWPVGGLKEDQNDDLTQNLWLERASGTESYVTTSIAQGGLPVFSENIPEGDLVVKFSQESDSRFLTSKTASQNLSGAAGSVHEQMPWVERTKQPANRTSLEVLENNLVRPTSGSTNHDSVLLVREEPTGVVSDGPLPSRIVDNGWKRSSGDLPGLRTGALQESSMAFLSSKQQTGTPALNLASSIKDERAGSNQEELVPQFRSSVISNGMKPRDPKELQFLFAQSKKLPFSDLGDRESLFSSRLLDKSSFQPSSTLGPANLTASDAVSSTSDYQIGLLSASDQSSADAFSDQKRELKSVNQNEGREKRAKNDDFTALEQHINDLTQEKFSLQRALDAARSLAESLSQQNSALTEDFNSQGAIINQLQAELEKRKEEVTAQSLVLSSLMMERERAQQENNSAVERSQILAGEVIALEEKVLKLRSSELKLQRELETLKSDNDSFRLHSSTLEKDRQNMRSMLEALQEDKKLLHSQLQKALVTGDGLRTSNTKEVLPVDSRDASTSTDDLGVPQNIHITGSVIQRHVSDPQLPETLDNSNEASSSNVVSSHHSLAFGVPPTLATLSADDFRAINNIDVLITELISEKEALLETLKRESAKALEFQALNIELSKKLETQTQRLELVVSQNMAHGDAVATNSIEIEPQDYVDEGDEVVERVLGWIMRLFPGGSSRRQSSKLL